MKIRFAHINLALPSLWVICNAHGHRSDSCSNIHSPQHPLRQSCPRTENNSQRKNDKHLPSSSQQLLTGQETSSQLWSYTPECMYCSGLGTNMCVYTSKTFKSNRGISIIATPKSASSVAENAVFHHLLLSTTAIGVFESPYEMRPIPGRGFGLVANRTVQRGEKIFEDTPILIAQPIAEKDGLTEEELYRLYRVAVERLPKKSQELVMGLHGHFGGDAVYDRFSTNAFNVFDFAALFPETSRMNHDCRPNAGYYFDKTTFTHKVHAVREISPEEEITISYITPFLTSQQRLDRIPDQWGFNCTCSLCSSSKEHLAASDRRLEEIRNLEAQLKDLSPTRIAKVETAEKLISLYKEEGFETPVAKAYSFAALEHIYVGNRRMAREFAALAVEMLRLWYGSLSEDVRLMDSIAREPEKHVHWKLFDKS
ncbi:SET domain-containing protein 5 [Venturia nashicola]|uniref:SET domain-containing protein 5 n=1 Tax=Venturia nashicola TaxID=86259 RepID=A0A4Z1P638_9PEZI|nr:SET domain-containing protein 5 [Venturia nashicola]TLD26189.1 SET domain-containing protein 5 [Venturia nashicola]